MHARTAKHKSESTTPPTFNWPIVILLAAIAGIPGLPAIALIIGLLAGAPADGSPHAFVHMQHFITPMPLLLHGGAGIAFFLAMPSQFSPAIRKKYLHWHKRAGYTTLISGCLLAASAPWMHAVFSHDASLARYWGVLVMSAGIIIALGIAFYKVINGHIRQHQQWMTRAVAIVLGAVTPLFLEVPIYLIWGGLDQAYEGLARLEHDYGRWLGMVVNLIIVEIAFYRARAREQLCT